MNKEKIKLYVKVATFWSVILIPSSLLMPTERVSAEPKVEVKVRKKVVKKITPKITQKATRKEPVQNKSVVKISKKGEKLIKSFESLSLVSYRLRGESSNTIGWGHKINSEDPLWLRQKYVGYTITEDEAEKIFQSDMEEFINPALNRIMKELNDNKVSTAKLNQNFIDGLASLVYNCGESGVKRTQFYKYLYNNQIDKAIESVESTLVSMEGHKTRRSAEKELMSKL